jgi:hypothetical protein
MSTTGNATLQSELKSVIDESHDILSALTAQQRAALEAKYYLLPEEVRSAIDSKYPNLPTAAKYIARQSVKEANGKLASLKRPEWYNKLLIAASSMKNGDKTAEKTLREFAEELDTKESVNLLKKYKTAHDMTSKDAHIIQLAGIFGVSPANLA